MANLKGQTLSIPPLQNFIHTWKTSHDPHPLHARLRAEVVDPVLESLISHPKALAKAQESDTALLVCGLFPSLTSNSDFEKLKTAAIWLVWIVLWDDIIDSPGEDGEIDAEEYVRSSKEYVRWCLLGGTEGVTAPTKACELMKAVGARLRDVNKWDEGDRKRLWESLEGYMDDCLVEYKVRVSGKDEMEIEISGCAHVTENEFWMWRTGTSGVEAFCLMGSVMNGGGGLPKELLKGEELKKMEMAVNKAFVVVNELFSLKKELEDGALMNLIPIAMQDRNCSLADAVRGITDDFLYYIGEFQEQASQLRTRVAEEYGGEVDEMVEKPIGAYQAIVTGIVDFSIQSPRYGIKEYQKDNGSFDVPL